ncbi:mechanosensitive ion channel domain-containing protein [Desulfolutivibrio sulfoxidireducens]|uniref:mechanosensitive ion channel domain-containing protein n=1 Tax=Desulfolutivibrio sulfoxidireducens TaxID=2773299 RepID=UPI00159D4742|nr:mechanosensitive ion channel domain-containing protein [Desulfolutivibrio sulfoxidireducens]QLA17309.1 mechanosensitive ion channel [Desulfolutivibrio sulfoxidireducens]QLA20874.1 mechanosensitive ion channel [Desulfolutivibrio sulfoxidireducens]
MHTAPPRPCFHLTAVLAVLAALLWAWPGQAARQTGEPRLLLDQARLDIREAGESITRARAKLNARRQETDETVTALKRKREELALWAWMADAPWDLRDVIEGVDDLRGRIETLLAAPNDQETEIVRHVSYLNRIESRVMQSLYEGLSPDTDVQLRLVLGDLITLRVRLDDLRTDMEQSLRPARDLLASVDAWNDSLRQELYATWKPYYLERVAWMSDLVDPRALADAMRGWFTALSLAVAVSTQDRAPWDWLVILNSSLLAGLAAWYILRYLLRRFFREHGQRECGRQLSRAVFCACIGLAVGFLAKEVGFVVLSTLSSMAEVFFTAGLVFLSRALTLLASGPCSPPRTFTRWPLWYLFCLGLLLQVPGIPDPVATPVFALSLLAAAYLIHRRGHTAETRLDAALSLFCVVALPVLAAVSLAGFARAAILATSVLFYVVLSVRLSMAVVLIVGRWRGRSAEAAPSLRIAILSGLGFPLVFLSILYLTLLLGSNQFEATDLFLDLLAQEARFEYFNVSAKRVLAVILAFYLTKMAVAVSGSFLRVHGEPVAGADSDGTGGAIHSLATLAGYFWWAAFILCSLFLVGFSPTGLAVVAGGLSVGIGFGLQNIVNNFISGLILLFGRAVETGDVIQLGGDMVVVRRVNIRNTVVRTMDNATIFVPNSELISGRLTNLSHKDRAMRREVAVGVAYGSDRDLVRRLLLQAASESPRVLTQPPPSVIFADFGASTLDFRLRVWVTEPEDSMSILSGVRDRIDALFREHGVEIAFPQTDVHLRSAPGLARATGETTGIRPPGRADDADGPAGAP